PSPAAGGRGPVGGGSVVADGGGSAFRGFAEGPAAVDLRELALLPAPSAPPRDPVGRPESPIPEELAEELRAHARTLPPSRDVRAPGESSTFGPAPAAASVLGGFEGPAFGDAGSSLVPPDPELAAGPEHLLAVFNAGFTIYDKSGAVLSGPTGLASLFSTTPGCDGSPFDPNALYDEEADRFVIGADGGGSSYCLAASAGPDPTGVWHTYAFATDFPSHPSGPFFFDYPHAGVGREAIYMGANLFSGGFFEGRVWAVDKTAVYAGAASPAVITHSTGSRSTPQPANLHGFAQGTWPAAGPHYLLTDDSAFSGARLGVWSWADPFGADDLVLVGEVDLAPATGAAGFPLPAPQSGAVANLDANDWRVQDAEYRNGELWTTQTVSCNPGGGTVDCIRWARIDPATPAVLDAGLLGSDGVYRIFGDLAANHCGDLAVGYTTTGPALFPSVAVAGRRIGDAPGSLGPETELRGGDRAYSSFDASPLRWGDYTGLTPDPDGLGLWYLGEYSRDLVGEAANWGSWIGSLVIPGCPLLAAAPEAVDFGGWPEGGLSPPHEVVLANAGDAALALSGMTLSDPSRFFLDTAGGAEPCHSTMPTIPAGQQCTVTVSFGPDATSSFDATLTIDSLLEANQRVLPLSGQGVACAHPAVVEVTNAAEQNGFQEEFACLRLEVGPYLLGPSGRLELTSGVEVVLRNEATVRGEMLVTIDPLQTLP
ncbi:MAG: hypothetical protein R3325_11915, partial [Thermoanaerobaculia bacterium]|nr:hypothetical protein [Thermoanaerobaculia bacterium]